MSWLEVEIIHSLIPYIQQKKLWLSFSHTFGNKVPKWTGHYYVIITQFARKNSSLVSVSLI